ncbi:penicillin acylase family protein [Streptomyces sp. NPDC055287]
MGGLGLRSSRAPATRRAQAPLGWGELAAVTGQVALTSDTSRPSPGRRLELGRESRDWTAQGVTAIHMDTYLAAAGPLLEQVARLDDLGPDAKRLRARLLSWDRHMDADSIAAADYARLRSAVSRRIAAAAQLKSLAVPPPYPSVFEPWLTLTPKVAFASENLLTTCRLPGLAVPDIVRAAMDEVADAEPVAWGGPCVLATSSTPGVTDLSPRGPSARYVWDLSRRESSLWIVPLGARGIPLDAHHRDQLPLWVRGELVPVITDFARLTEED